MIESGTFPTEPLSSLARVRPADRGDALAHDRSRTLQVEQVRLLYASAPAALAATIVCVLMLAAVEWNASPRLPLLAWLISMVVLTSLRYLLVRRFRRVLPEQQEQPIWKTLFLAGAALAGLGWGSTMFFLLPESSIPHQVFLVFMLGGITAGAVSTLSARLDAFLWFSLPIMAPVALYFLRSGDSLAAAMAAMIVFFGLVMIVVAARVNTTIVQSLTLQFENAGLLRRMSAHALHVGQAANALRLSEERYRLLVTQATDFIYRTDATGHFTFINPTAMRLTGHAATELLGHRFIEFIRPDYRAHTERFYGRQFVRKTPTTYFEFPAITKDGREIWFGQNVQILLEDSRVVGFSAVARDITGRKRTEENLRRSQAFLSSLIENLPDMIFVKDAKDLRFVRFNKAGEELIGLPREALIGQNDYDLFPTAQADFFTARDREVLTSGRLTDIPEEPILTADKGIRVLHTKKIPIYDEAGSPQFLLGISEDITQKKQSEKALQESEERFRLLFEQGTVPMTLLDHEKRYTRVNQAFCDLVGYDEHELIGQTYALITHPDDLPRNLALTERALSEKSFGRYDLEKRYLRKDGTLRWVSVTASRLILPESNAPFILAFIQDITDRKRAEQALQESEERFRQLADHVKEVFWLSEVDKNSVSYVSPAYEEIWGRTLESLYASPRSWLEAIHPDDRDRVLLAATTRQRTGEYDEEYRILRPDGSVRWIRDQGFPIRDETGHVYRVAGIARDITERKRAEEALHAARQAREQLARNLHDNIIQAIYAIGLTVEESQSIARTSPIGATRKLDQVVASLNRVIREVRGYLAVPVEEQPETLSADELISSFKHLDSLMEHADGVRFDMAIAPDAACALTGSQRAQFLSVAREAMSNSLRHSNASTARVSLACTPRGVRLEIRDNGVGFALSRMRNGNGGLKNIRLRARKIGANLDIASHPMGGTVVSLEIHAGL